MGVGGGAGVAFLVFKFVFGCLLARAFASPLEGFALQADLEVVVMARVFGEYFAAHFGDFRIVMMVLETGGWKSSDGSI